jgi:hypothetical protein
MMKKTSFLLVALVAASAFAAACAFEQHSNVLAPSSPGTGVVSNTPVSSSYLGTWASTQSVATPTPSTCGNFQWQVTSQTATSIAGNFSIACAGGLTISGSATGQLNGNAASISLTGTANFLIPPCSFSLTGTGEISNGDTLTIPYSGTTCFGPVHGTETLHRRTEPAPAPPPPAPAPDPTPPPPPSPSGPNDAIDLSGATIHNSPSDIARWPATATITLLDLGTNGVHIDFTRKDGPGSWPDVSFMTPGENLQYTLWIVLNINGTWHASGCIEFWRGLDRNGGPPSQYSQNWYYDPSRWGPMSGYQPAPGERVGFLVTAGDSRNNGNVIVKERSNVVVVPFPSGGGGTFRF